MIVSANQLIENGIRVYMYPGMSHVKAAVFDGWATFGTANYDRLSFRVNKEINIATSHPPAVEGLVEQIFRPDFAASIELTEPAPNKWSDRIVEIAGDFIF
jgi:cardiolipin synthase